MADTITITTPAKITPPSMQAATIFPVLPLFFLGTGDCVGKGATPFCPCTGTFTKPFGLCCGI